MKPPSPLHAPEQQPLKPPSPLQPKNAPKTPISHPQRRCRFQLPLDLRPQRRQGFQTSGPSGLQDPDAIPVGDGRPGRATNGQPTLQTSSNRRYSNRIARTPVTNVVNLSRKISVFGEKALGLTTFVTTRTRAPQKLNTRDPHDAHSKQQGLAKLQANAPSNISDQAPLVWRAPEGPEARLRRPWVVARPGRASRRGTAEGGRTRASTHAPSPARLEGGGGAWPGTPEPQAPPVWRAPEGPEGTGGLRGAAPNAVRPPSLAGGRALRRPEHQRRHKQQHAGTNDERAGGPPPTGTHSGPALQGRPSGARNTNAARTRTERIPYSPRNALIAGISRTACTRPAR